MPTIRLYDVQNGDAVVVINGGLSGMAGKILQVASDESGLVFGTATPPASKNWLLVGIESTKGMLAILDLLNPPPVTKLTMTPSSSGVRDACRITSGANTGRIIAVGTSGFSAYSDDEGQTWTTVVTGGTNDFVSVTWTGTNVVAVGISGIAGYSTDGTSWTTQTIASGSHRFGIAYHSGLLIAVGNDTSSQISSDDGVTWTAGGTLPASGWHGFGLNTATGLFIAGGASGNIASTTDGVTWTGVVSGSGDWQALAYNQAATLWTIVNSIGGVATSPDGSTWTTRTSISAGSAGSIQFANGFWVVGCAGGSSNVAYTADPVGGSWTLVSTSSRDVEGLLPLAS